MEWIFVLRRVVIVYDVFISLFFALVMFDVLSIFILVVVDIMMRKDGEVAE